MVFFTRHQTKVVPIGDEYNKLCAYLEVYKVNDALANKDFADEWRDVIEYIMVSTHQIKHAPKIAQYLFSASCATFTVSPAHARAALGYIIARVAHVIDGPEYKTIKIPLENVDIQGLMFLLREVPALIDGLTDFGLCIEDNTALFLKFLFQCLVKVAITCLVGEPNTKRFTISPYRKFPYLYTYSPAPATSPDAKVPVGKESKAGLAFRGRPVSKTKPDGTKKRLQEALAVIIAKSIQSLCGHLAEGHYYEILDSMFLDMVHYADRYAETLGLPESWVMLYATCAITPWAPCKLSATFLEMAWAGVDQARRRMFMTDTYATYLNATLLHVFTRAEDSVFDKKKKLALMRSTIDMLAAYVPRYTENLRRLQLNIITLLTRHDMGDYLHEIIVWFLLVAVSARETDYKPEWTKEEDMKQQACSLRPTAANLVHIMLEVLKTITVHGHTNVFALDCLKDPLVCSTPFMISEQHPYMVPKANSEVKRDLAVQYDYDLYRNHPFIVKWDNYGQKLFLAPRSGCGDSSCSRKCRIQNLWLKLGRALSWIHRSSQEAWECAEVILHLVLLYTRTTNWHFDTPCVRELVIGLDKIICRYLFDWDFFRKMVRKILSFQGEPTFQHFVRVLGPGIFLRLLTSAGGKVRGDGGSVDQLTAVQYEMEHTSPRLYPMYKHISFDLYLPTPHCRTVYTLLHHRINTAVLCPLSRAPLGNTWTLEETILIAAKKLSSMGQVTMVDKYAHVGQSKLTAADGQQIDDQGQSQDKKDESGADLTEAEPNEFLAQKKAQELQVQSPIDNLTLEMQYATVVAPMNGTTGSTDTIDMVVPKNSNSGNLPIVVLANTVRDMEPKEDLLSDYDENEDFDDYDTDDDDELFESIREVEGSDFFDDDDK